MYLASLTLQRPQVLKDDTTLEENKVSNENFVVVMVQRVSPLPQSTSAACNEGAPSPVHRYHMMHDTISDLLTALQPKKAPAAPKNEQPAAASTPASSEVIRLHAPLFCFGHCLVSCYMTCLRSGHSNDTGSCCLPTTYLGAI
jgi:hypothetical protein